MKKSNAQQGLETLLLHAQGHRDPRHKRNPPNAPTTGWTTPAPVFEKMKAIEAVASELNGLVIGNIRRPEFVTAWKAWLTRWRDFNDRYQGYGRQLSVIFYSDDFARQVEDFRRELEAFQNGYRAERDAEGKPLPAPITPVPQPEPKSLPPEHRKGEEDEGWSLPWWVWVLGTAAAIGLGYSFYRNIKETQAKKAALEKAIPSVLSRYGMPKEIGEAAVAHDPNSTFVVYEPILSVPANGK